jgi:glycosyltransferase involved in cell wall biosynthesis
MKLVIFTESFPFTLAAENTFLQHEIKYLLDVFKDITIVPRLAIGDEQELNSKIIIDKSFYDNNLKNHNRSILYLKTLISSNFLMELFYKRSQLSIKKIKKIIKYYTTALYVKYWFKNYIVKNNLENESLIFYTYWSTSTTLGLGLLKKYYPKLKLITRAHGIDLYEERGFVYFRKKTLELVNSFYVVSKNASEYLTSKYPKYAFKVKFAGLGVISPAFISKASRDDVFRIVSCSSNDLNKRVELIFEGLKEIINVNKIIRIEWNHFGDGPLLNKLRSLINTNPNNNLVVKLMGWVKNQELIEYYKNNPIDLFISTSSSEGRPVSMQEAQSCGIPILASAVGGVPEIVNLAVGLLISPDPTPNEIAEGILFFINNPEKTERMKQESIKNWKLNFNADINFKKFANELRLLSEAV